jgi:hypothetical protein
MTGNENNRIELEIVVASQRVARMRMRNPMTGSANQTEAWMR